MTSDQTPSLIYLTDSQRRRAQALMLVRHLFGGLPGPEARRIAAWICTGKFS